MVIRFDNDFTKQWLARKGPAKVFGKDVDTRERLSDPEAVAWFDRIWESNLQRAVEQASPCDIDFVRSKVPHYAQNFIDATSRHREFTFANCLFICQLPDPQTCNQLWFIPSASADPANAVRQVREGADQGGIRQAGGEAWLEARGTGREDTARFHGDGHARLVPARIGGRQ